MGCYICKQSDEEEFGDFEQISIKDYTCKLCHKVNECSPKLNESDVGKLLDSYSLKYKKIKSGGFTTKDLLGLHVDIELFFILTTHFSECQPQKELRRRSKTMHTAFLSMSQAQLKSKLEYYERALKTPQQRIEDLKREGEQMRQKALERIALEKSYQVPLDRESESEGEEIQLIDLPSTPDHRFVIEDEKKNNNNNNRNFGGQALLNSDF